MCLCSYKNWEYLPILALIAKSEIGLYLRPSVGLNIVLSYLLYLETLKPVLT